jgi:hypothetical protein
VRISFTGTLEGGRVLYNIGKIEAASAWHPENSEPLQHNWRELILRELIRTAEISTPPPSSGSITKTAAPCGSTRPA